MPATLPPGFEIERQPGELPEGFEVDAAPATPPVQRVMEPQRPAAAEVDTTPGTVRGLWNELRVGIKRAQEIPAVAAMLGTGGGPTWRQQRAGFEAAMLDPRYGTVADEPIYFGMEQQGQSHRQLAVESQFGPAAKTAEIIAPQTQAREIWTGVVSDFQNEIGKIKQSAPMQRLAQAKTDSEKWAVWRQDPVEITASIMLNSLPPSIAGGVLGSAALGPGAGTAAGAALSSYAAEVSAGTMEAAQRLGYDPRDPAQLSKFLEDPRYDEEMGKIVGGAAVVAGFDGATAGAAGKFVAPALRQGLRKVLTASGKEIAMQAAGGAAGETGKQLVQGGDLDTFEIGMEALAEVGTGPTEVLGNVRESMRPQQTPPRAPIPDVIPPAGIDVTVPPVPPGTATAPALPPIAAPTVALFRGPDGQEHRVILGNASLEQVQEMVFRTHPGSTFLGIEGNAEGRRQNEEVPAQTPAPAPQPDPPPGFVVEPSETELDYGLGAEMPRTPSVWEQPEREVSQRGPKEVQRPKEVAPSAAGNAPPAAEPDTTTELATGLKVVAVELPLSEIEVDNELVPQFKRNANATTGEVQGQELKSQKYIRPSNPIVVWELANGRKVVVTGRHRLALARRLGEQTIPATIVREADGFTREMATTLDAEFNIRDGQGEVDDYATYFEGTSIGEEEARARGLLDRAKGEAGWHLARSATDDLKTLYQNDKISAEKAVAIARAAPGNAALQRLGIRQAGKAVEEIVNFMRAVQAQTGGQAAQVDLFGADDSAIQAAEQMAQRASTIQKGIKDQIAAVQGAAKRPEVARKLGVDVTDPEGINRRLAELRAEAVRWQNWALHPDLVAQAKGEQAVPTTTPAPAPSPPAPAIEHKLVSTAQKDSILARLRKKSPPPGEPPTLKEEPTSRDPSYFNDALQLGIYYLEEGIQTFPEWSHRMLSDLGENIRPLLKSLYDTAIQTYSPGSSPAGGSESADPRSPGRRSDLGGSDSASITDDPLPPPEKRIIVVRPELTPTANESVVPVELIPHLDTHQRQGAAAAISAMEAEGGFLLADGTGVGKTRQALAVAHYYATRGRRVLIVTKAETIKPNWPKNTFAGSYAFDAQQMRVRLKLARNGQLQPGEIGITTYDNLRDVARTSRDGVVIIFDEAHALKNADSARSKAGLEAIANADKVLFMSATPADKPLHIHYLARMGIFEGQSVDVALRGLGLKQIEIERNQKKFKVWVLDEGVNPQERLRRFKALFDRMTAAGRMLKREISMQGVRVRVLKLGMPPEAKELMDDIARFFGVRHADDAPGLLKARILMHQRRQQEPYKIASAVLLAKRELAAGRQVVIFVSRVNTSEVGKWQTIYLPGGEVERVRKVLMESEGTTRTLVAALREQGITDIAEIHGAAEQGAVESMSDFQNSKARVVVATIESGGTGINLDDSKGNAPRSMIVVTAPFSAVENVQAAGRIWRLKTQSNARLYYLFGDTDVDAWNADIIGSKMAQLGATVEGQVRTLNVADPDLVTNEDFEDHLAGLPPEPSPTASFPALEWRPFVTRKGKQRFVAEATPEFWKWWEAAGKGDNALGVTVSKWEGRWQVWSDQPVQPGDGRLREQDDFSLFAPESVAEQKARLAREADAAKKKAAQEKIAQKAAAKLTGTTGDLGQQDMFGGGDLFSVPPGAPPLTLEERRSRVQRERDARQQGQLVFAGIVGDVAQAFTPQTADTRFAGPVTESVGQTLGLEGRLRTDLRHTRLLAQEISEDLVQQGKTDIVGKEVASAADLALLAQTFRTPQFEIFHLIVTKDETIVGRFAVTARSADTTFSWLKGQDVNIYKNLIAAYGGDGFYMLHNHPSGDVIPSPADVAATKFVADKVAGFKGHIVIDHLTFAEINAQGSVEVKKLRGADIPDPLRLRPSAQGAGAELLHLNRRIIGPSDVADMGKRAQSLTTPGSVMVFFADNRGRLHAAGEVPVASWRLANTGLIKELRLVAKHQGATQIFAFYGGDRAGWASIKPTVTAMVKAGTLRDAVWQNAVEEPWTHSIRTAENVRNTELFPVSGADAMRIAAPPSTYGPATQTQIAIIEGAEGKANQQPPAPTTATSPELRSKVRDALGTTSGKVVYYGGQDLLRAKQQLDMTAAYQAAAVQRQSDALMRQLWQAGYDAATGFKLPAWMKVGAWARRVRDFKRRVLHVAARLNVTARNPDGSFAFAPFNMRAGRMTVAAFRAGKHTVGDTILHVDPTTGTQETLTIGPLVITPDGRTGYQLFRSVDANTQAELYRHYADTYPELIWLLDMFIDPALANTRQTINGIEVPVFNRFAQASMMADADPNFTPLTGYTPDVLVSRSLVGAIKGTLSFRAGTRSPGRKYKFGTSREGGYVRDLLTGFNIRTFQMLQEDARKAWRQAVLRAAKPIVKGQVPVGWVKIETGMEQLWQAVRQLRTWTSPIDPATGDPIFPETEARMTDDQTAEYKQFFGEAAALRGRQLMLPQPLVDSLIAQHARRVEHNALYRLGAWAIRNSTQLFLVHPVTYVANVGTNELFALEAATRYGLAGLMKRDARDLRFARNLLAGMVTNRFAAFREWIGAGTQTDYMRALREVLPDQLFADATSLADVKVRWGVSALDYLRQGELGAAALQVIRYGNIDLRAKQRMAFAMLKANAVTQAKQAGLRGPAMRSAVERYLANPPAADRVQAVAAANFEILNYADSPELLNKFAQSDYSRLLLPFPRFGYHYVTKQAKRLAAVKTLLAKVPADQRADALADLITVGLYGMGGGGLAILGLAALAGGEDDDDIRKVVGASTVPVVGVNGVAYKPMDRTMVTANRLNLSAWARATGLGGEGENDFWWRVRNYPVIAMAGTVALAIADAKKHGPKAGARALARAAGDLAGDFFSVGAGFKVPAKFLAEMQSLDSPQPTPSVVDPYATYVPTSVYVTEQLMGSFVPGVRQANELIAWVDPVDRRRTPSKTIEYQPGVKEALKVGHWTGLADRLLRGGVSDLPPAGPVNRRTGEIDARESTDNERLLRVLGLNVRPIPRERYERQLGE